MSLSSSICREAFSHGRDITVRLSDIGSYHPTMALSKDDLSETGNECILYGELFTTYGRAIHSVKSHTHVRTETCISLSESNDLLFPASTTVDALSLISPSAISKAGIILGGDMFVIRLKPDYNNVYMSHLLALCYRNKLAAYAQGSTIIHIHYSDIKNVRIHVHPKRIQDKIAETLDAADKRIVLEERVLECLKEQKHYLLNRLFI